MMQQAANIIDRLWDKVLVFIGVLLVLLPISPINMSTIYRDSGVFQYIGWRILNGGVPYLDIWDQKPPVIFYLDALGISISNHSRWGIWIIEFIALLIAAYLGFQLIRKSVGSIPAVLSLLIGMLSLNYFLEGGNLAEEYALPLQFAALWIFFAAQRSIDRSWRWYVTGFLGSLAFFTKQTSFGIWISIVIFLLIRAALSGRMKDGLIKISKVILGSLPVCLAVVLYFGLRHALAQFWSAAFKYNFAYSLATSWVSKMKEIAVSGITTLAHIPTGLFYFVIIGYLVGVILILYRRDLLDPWLPLLAVMLIDLPIELILVNLSGRNYAHYYITMLPVLLIFVGLTIWVLNGQLFAWKVPLAARHIFIFGLLAMIALSSFRDYHAQVIKYAQPPDTGLIDYIDKNTSPGDYVLLWGAESSYNFLSQRVSPTRFVYLYPLYQPGYTNEGLIEEFLGEVIHNQPRLIIDTKNALTPLFKFNVSSTTIDAGTAFLESHYQRQGEIGIWTVYSFVQSTPP